MGGGAANTAAQESATVAGGLGNTANLRSFVGGGENNAASGQHAAVSGGLQNTASGQFSSVVGGQGNTASGSGSVVPGGDANAAAGSNSFAAGLRAQANHASSFVWSDSKGFDFASTAADQWSARSTGGARFVSAIDALGNPSAGVTLSAGAGAWSSISDRESKENFQPAEGQQVLERLLNVPVGTWNWKSQDPTIRHIGPIAQDFRAAFGVGEDETRISTVDADGVALAAIQGLYAELKERDARIAQLETRLSRLEGSVANGAQVTMDQEMESAGNIARSPPGAGPPQGSRASVTAAPNVPWNLILILVGLGIAAFLPAGVAWILRSRPSPAADSMGSRPSDSRVDRASAQTPPRTRRVTGPQGPSISDATLRHAP